MAHVLDGTIPLSEAALGEGKRSAARLEVMSFPKPPPPRRMPLPPSTMDPPEEKKSVQIAFEIIFVISTATLHYRIRVPVRLTINSKSLFSVM